MHALRYSLSKETAIKSPKKEYNQQKKCRTLPLSRTVRLSLSCQAGCDNGMTTCCTSQVGACMLLKNRGLAPCQHAPMRTLMYVAQYPHRFWRETIWDKTCCRPPAAYDAELKHNQLTLTPQAHAHHRHKQPCRARRRTESACARAQTALVTAAPINR